MIWPRPARRARRRRDEPSTAGPTSSSRGSRIDAERAAPSSERGAALLATGEVETANLLTAALERAGVPAVCAEVHRHGPFVAPGTEDPVGVDAAALRALLEEVPVVCFPGFGAVQDSPERAPALLGRGGSDLTAVVLGRDLGAAVTLVKDVEGLYTSDPAARVAADGSPRRLSRVSFDEALALGDAILQFARSASRVITASPSASSARTHRGRQRQSGRRPGRPAIAGRGAAAVRITLLGLGEVGDASSPALHSSGALRGGLDPGARARTGRTCARRPGS